MSSPRLTVRSRKSKALALPKLPSHLKFTPESPKETFSAFNCLLAREALSTRHRLRVHLADLAEQRTRHGCAPAVSFARLDRRDLRHAEAVSTRGHSARRAKFGEGDAPGRPRVGGERRGQVGRRPIGPSLERSLQRIYPLLTKSSSKANLRPTACCRSFVSGRVLRLPVEFRTTPIFGRSSLDGSAASASVDEGEKTTQEVESIAAERD